jgi:tRNA A37 threonylcarbamoyladenosine modification protein TsaB
LIAPEDAAALLPGDVAVAVGSGAELLAETAEMRSRRVVTAALPDLQPEARSLAVLALAGGETSTTVRPLYLRPPDAKPQAAATLRKR